ncbi:hypothetical protein OSB04_009318 [Centaurea solstitialis]|uniref:H(+)-transporting two-sector ATPase n=1 Tax=Centaurea solstitialis TaxID=347529 RepID=A0AA38WM14_9ASTR|nr:hypothetical protein OSB04_009318 [Centaurea solstitialis]
MVVSLSFGSPFVFIISGFWIDFMSEQRNSFESHIMWVHMNNAKLKVALVYGLMNEPSGAHMRVGLTALTMVEYFRDVNEQGVLLFIDNIFRFVQARFEVSALSGRMHYVVGYQPTLNTEMDALQERITSTKEGSITSIHTVYVPANDLTLEYFKYKRTITKYKNNKTKEYFTQESHVYTTLAVTLSRAVPSILEALYRWMKLDRNGKGMQLANSSLFSNHLLIQTAMHHHSLTNSLTPCEGEIRKMKTKEKEDAHLNVPKHVQRKARTQLERYEPQAITNPPQHSKTNNGNLLKLEQRRRDVVVTVWMRTETSIGRHRRQPPPVAEG